MSRTVGFRVLDVNRQYRAAPYYYALAWVLVIGLALALIGGDGAAPVAVALFMSFVALWIAAGLVLRSDWRIERGTAFGTSRSAIQD